MQVATFLDPTKHRTPYGEYPSVDVPSGWPDAHLIARPRDQIGEAIIAYAKKWRDHPDFPASPWDDRTGTINLVPPDQPRPATDPIPRYRLREFGAVGPSVYPAGAQLDLSSWPRNPSLLEPMNTSAELVLSYMARCAGRPLPAMMPHANGALNLPSPGLDGVPLNYSHRASGVFGDAA
jgi:hypothetical protein